MAAANISTLVTEETKKDSCMHASPYISFAVMSDPVKTAVVMNETAGIIVHFGLSLKAISSCKNTLVSYSDYVWWVGCFVQLVSSDMHEITLCVAYTFLFFFLILIM